MPSRCRYWAQVTWMEPRITRLYSRQWQRCICLWDSVRQFDAASSRRSYWKNQKRKPWWLLYRDEEGEEGADISISNLALLIPIQWAIESNRDPAFIGGDATLPLSSNRWLPSVVAVLRWPFTATFNSLLHNGKQFWSNGGFLLVDMQSQRETGSKGFYGGHRGKSSLWYVLELTCSAS